MSGCTQFCTTHLTVVKPFGIKIELEIWQFYICTMRKMFFLLLMIPLVGFGQTAQEWMKSANKKMEEGNTLGAIKDYTAALDLQPELVDAYYGRGSVYAELFTYDMALKDFNKAIALDSTMGIAIFNRGVVYSAQGYHALAKKDFDHYVRLRPMDPQGYLARAEYHQQRGDTERANMDYKKVASLEPVDADGYVSRSEVKLLLGDTSGAIKDISLCIEKKPEFTEAYFFRSQLYSAQGQGDRAIDDLNIVLLNKPQNTKALIQRGYLYAKNGILQAAVEDMARGLEIDQNQPEVWFDLGYNLLELEDFAKAIQAFNNSLATGIQDTELAYYNKGVAEFNNKMKEEACRSMSRAGELGAEHRIRHCK